MPVTDGHITAPFGLAAVAQTLGEAALDTQTLCRSSKINPYSLIRPLFRGTGVSGTLPDPGTDPCAFSASAVTSWGSGILCPASKASEIAEVNLKTVSETAFPHKADYNYTQNLSLAYAPMPYGYLVPYVTSAAAIIALIDVYWRRYGPGDSATDSNGLLTETRAEMQQFDGYLHAAEPLDPLAKATLEYGEIASYVPNLPNGSGDTGRYLRDEIFNFLDTSKTKTKANPGGVVSIPAVFGAGSSTYSYGVTLYSRSGSSAKFAHVASALWDNAGTPNPVTGLPTLTLVKLGTRITSDGEYLLVPWIGYNVKIGTDGLPAQASSAGMKIFGFRYASQFTGYLRKEIKTKHISIGSVYAGLADFTISMNGKTCTVTFILHHRYQQYPLTGKSFCVRLKIKRPANLGGGTEYYNIGTSEAAGINTQDTSMDNKITFMGGTVGTQGTVTLGSSTVDGVGIFQSTAKVVVDLPGTASDYAQVSVDKICMVSEDKNHTGVTINVPVVYNAETQSVTPYPPSIPNS